MFKHFYKTKNIGQSILYQNQDIGLNFKKFFVNIQDDHLDLKFFKQMIWQPLNDQIYYAPSSAPYRNYYDIRQGSLYQDYVIPTSAFEFKTEGDTVLVSEIQPTVDRNSYITKFCNLVQQQVDRIYHNHSHVVLQFSGGIDSLVALSFVMAGGYLDRTSLVLFDNYVQSDTDPEQLRNHRERNRAVNDLFDQLRDQCCDIQRISIHDQSIVDAFNQHSFIEFKTYGTTELLKQYQNVAFINGFYGNQMLLHKGIFLDQLLLNSPNPDQLRQQLKQRLQLRNFYSTSMCNYSVDKELIPMSAHCMQSRNRAELDGFNRNRVYMIYACGEQLCRQLDFSTLAVDDIVDAGVAREIIQRNVGNKLDSYIICESLAECDHYIKKWFDRDQLNPYFLDIPTNMTHHPDAVKWLANELAQPKIELNSLISVKMLHWISNFHNANGRY